MDVLSRKNRKKKSKKKHPISHECVNQFTFWLKFLIHISVISNNRCLNSNSVLWLLSWVARILKDTSVFLKNNYDCFAVLYGDIFARRFCQARRFCRRLVYIYRIYTVYLYIIYLYHTILYNQSSAKSSREKIAV